MSMIDVVKKLRRMAASGTWDPPDRLDPLEAGSRAAIYLSSDPQYNEAQREMLKRWAMEALRLLAEPMETPAS